MAYTQSGLGDIQQQPSTIPSPGVPSYVLVGGALLLATILLPGNAKLIPLAIGGIAFFQLANTSF